MRNHPGGPNCIRRARSDSVVYSTYLYVNIPVFFLSETEHKPTRVDVVAVKMEREISPERLELTSQIASATRYSRQPDDAEMQETCT